MWQALADHDAQLAVLLATCGESGSSLAALFDTRDEAKGLLLSLFPRLSASDLEGFADSLMRWRVANERAFQQEINSRSKGLKQGYLSPPENISSEKVYQSTRGLDIKLECKISKSPRQSLGKLLDVSKSEADSESTKYWGLAVLSAIEEAGFPLMEMSKDSADPLCFKMRALGGKSWRTLRNRARAWGKYVTWLRLVSGRGHESNLHDVLDYVEFNVSEGCSKSLLQEFSASLAVVEAVGMVSLEMRLSAHPMWKTAQKSFEKDLVEGRTARKQAPPVSVAMIVSLELFVVHGDERYWRALAWICLICVWACLRVGDLEGIDRRRLSLSEIGLKGVFCLSVCL